MGTILFLRGLAAPDREPAPGSSDVTPRYNASKTFDEAARPWCVPARWHVDVMTRYHHGKLHAYLLLNRG